MRLKILLVSQYYYPAWEYGGPTVKAISLSQQLAHRGHEVSVLTSCPSQACQDPSSSRYRGAQRVGDVTAYYLYAALRFRGLTINPGILRFCQKQLRYYDVIHILGLYDFLGAAVQRLAKLWNIPYVIEPLGMYKPAIRNLLIKRFYHTFIGTKLLKHADCVIATSEAELSQIRTASFIEPERLLLRRNGIDFTLWEGPISLGSFRAEAGFRSTDRIVLFLGRMAPIKHLELLIDAFAGIEVPSAHLLLVGPQSERRYVKEMKLLAARRGIGGRIHFHGPVYGKRKRSLLADADLLVLSSYTENFGNVVAEAVLSGVPVVVTEGCGIAPYIRDRVGLVSGDSIEEYRNALFRILTDEALYRKFKANCPAVGKEFSWDEPVTLMESIYHKIVEERRARTQDVALNR